MMIQQVMALPSFASITWIAPPEIRSEFAMSDGLTYDSPTHFCQSRRTGEMPGPQSKYAIILTPEQEARLQQLRTCYMAPFATVQRAQIVLLAHHHPEWQNAEIARGYVVRFL
jgi:hypothetical protein